MVLLQLKEAPLDWPGHYKILRRCRGLSYCFFCNWETERRLGTIRKWEWNFFPVLGFCLVWYDLKCGKMQINQFHPPYFPPIALWTSPNVTTLAHSEGVHNRQVGLQPLTFTTQSCHWRRLTYHCAVAFHAVTHLPRTWRENQKKHTLTFYEVRNLFTPCWVVHSFGVIPISTAVTFLCDA